MINLSFPEPDSPRAFIWQNDVHAETCRAWESHYPSDGRIVQDHPDCDISPSMWGGAHSLESSPRHWACRHKNTSVSIQTVGVVQKPPVQDRTLPAECRGINLRPGGLRACRKICREPADLRPPHRGWPGNSCWRNMTELTGLRGGNGWGWGDDRSRASDARSQACPGRSCLWETWLTFELRDKLYKEVK